MTFFTTKNPDIILRAGQRPDSTHDFHLHMVILSLASPVFQAMFFPQPPRQAPIGQPDSPITPIIDVPDSPETFDLVLRFIYPGTEDPKISDLPTLTAVFSVAERYKIAHLWPVLGKSLEAFLPNDPSAVHIVACRFGLSEVAEEAARVLTPEYAEEQRIASNALSRITCFPQPGEDVGRSSIRDSGKWSPFHWPPLRGTSLKHLDDTKRVRSVFEERFDRGLRVDREGPFASPKQLADDPCGYDWVSNAIKHRKTLSSAKALYPSPSNNLYSDQPGADPQELALNRVMVTRVFGKRFGSG